MLLLMLDVNHFLLGVESSMNQDDVFLDHMEDFNELGSLRTTVYYTEILKETDKAYLFLLTPGRVKIWLPKSMIDMETSSVNLPTKKKFTINQYFFQQCYAKAKAASRISTKVAFDAIDEE